MTAAAEPPPACFRVDGSAFLDERHVGDIIQVVYAPQNPPQIDEQRDWRLVTYVVVYVRPRPKVEHCLMLQDAEKPQVISYAEALWLWQQSRIALQAAISPQPAW